MKVDKWSVVIFYTEEFLVIVEIGNDCEALVG